MAVPEPITPFVELYLDNTVSFLLRLYGAFLNTVTFLVYVETGRKTTDHVAKFTIGTTSTVATWRIKVNQIECSSTSK